MLRRRIIPCLLLREGGFVKTKRFGSHRYIGDAINAVRIFNDKQADELIVVDIDASIRGYAPRMEAIREIASECFMPVAFGGGMRTVEQMEAVFEAGIEKVIVSTEAVARPSIVSEAARRFGSQSIVVCIDYAVDADGNRRIASKSGTRRRGLSPTEHARRVVDAGAGELVLQAIERDGMKCGYDLETIREVTAEVDVPVIALGGAGCTADLAAAVRAGAAAAAAGSLFVYVGHLDGVLINMPTEAEVDAAFSRFNVEGARENSSRETGE